MTAPAEGRSTEEGRRRRSERDHRDGHQPAWLATGCGPNRASDLAISRFSNRQLTTKIRTIPGRRRTLTVPVAPGPEGGTERPAEDAGSVQRNPGSCRTRARSGTGCEDDRR